MTYDINVEEVHCNDIVAYTRRGIINIGKVISITPAKNLRVLPWNDEHKVFAGKVITFRGYNFIIISNKKNVIWTT